MGQLQSGFASEDEGKKTPSTSTLTPNSSSSSHSSLEDLIAEAAAEGGDENEKFKENFVKKTLKIYDPNERSIFIGCSLNHKTLDQKAQRALECPCVADLRKGPCGSHFSEAFVCFIKSTAEEKGSDCVSPFVALQNCIRANPDAFSKDVLEAEDDKEEQVQEYKIYPPSWAKEPK